MQYARAFYHIDYYSIHRRYSNAAISAKVTKVIHYKQSMIDYKWNRLLLWYLNQCSTQHNNLINVALQHRYWYLTAKHETKLSEVVDEELALLKGAIYFRNWHGSFILICYTDPCNHCTLLHFRTKYQKLFALFIRLLRYHFSKQYRRRRTLEKAIWCCFIR